MGLFRRRAGVAGVFAALVLGAAALFTVVLFAAKDEGTAQAATGELPTEVPRRDLPRVLDGDVRDSARVGDYIVAAGQFTKVELPNGEIRTASGAYAFHINTGEFIDAFTPQFHRSGGDPIIWAVEPAGPESVFLGGWFNSVDGHAHRGLTKVNIRTGAVDRSFAGDVVGIVRDIVVRNHRMFIGGEFEVVNGAVRHRLAELRPSTGAVTAFRADIEGTSRDPGDPFGPKYLDITPSNVLVVVHRGTTVAGKNRPGVALISLASGKVLPWRTSFYDSIANHSVDAEASPDGTYVVIAGDGGDFPFMGRDSAVRFDIDDVSDANVEPTWIARNFDSTYAVGISEDAVYLGGHFCWVEGPNAPEPWPGDGEFTNNNSCFGISPASRFAPQTVNRDQIAAFDPDTGKAFAWNPGTDGARGVLSIEVIDRGVLVGHDGSLMGKDGATPRSWNVGRFGFFDRTMPDGQQVSLEIDQPVTGTCFGKAPTMTGTNGDDVLEGTDGDDVIITGMGRDVIDGLGGNDIICAGRDGDVVRGGVGHDILHGNEAADLLDGGYGNDELWGGYWKDTLIGGPGHDVMRGGRGNDVLIGGPGNDTALGWDGMDRIEGGSGNDSLNGQVGRDTVIGGSGSDAVNGGVGRDQCAGSAIGQPNNPGDVKTGCER